MGIQKRISQLGIAKQTAKGAAATTPLYTIGLTGGQAYNAEVSEDDLNTSWSSRGLQGRDRISVVPGADFEAVAMPKSLGLLLLAACGVDTVTGTAPYSHKFTPGTTLPWMTLFGSLGVEKAALSDQKIDSLELSWDKTGAVKLKAKAMGRSIDFTSAWVPAATGEQVGGGVFKGAGGVFSVLGATARVTAGTIKIENKLDAVVASSSVTPDEIFEADVACSVSLTIVPDDTTLFRSVITGTGTGTSVSAKPLFGALDLKWVMDVSNDLEFVASNVNFACQMPTVDPNGGAAELSLEGVCVVASGSPSDPFAITLRNSVATY